jgi:putative ABC transport system permease protein
MIRWEAAVVAVFGAVLGVVLGVPFGIAACTALPDSFVSTVSIPWVSLVIYVLLAAVAGLAAAVFPARRAARLNILEAIAYS